MPPTRTRPARRARPAAAGPELGCPAPAADLAGSLAPLEPTGEVPLHLQLHSMLDRAVDAAGLVHGQRIWSESRLMRHYGVSRHVVRQALNQLVLEGRLSVRKGAGYFVNRRRVVTDLRAVAAASGQPASAEGFELELLDVGVGPTRDAEEADLVPGRRPPRVHRVSRVGRVDGEPVALLSTAFPVALARVVTRRAVTEGTVLAALAGHDRRPGHTMLRLGVTFASAADSMLLDVAEGAPLVEIRSRVCTDAGELVAVTRQLYRGDRFQFAYSAQLRADGWPVGSR